MPNSVSVQVTSNLKWKPWKPCGIHFRHEMRCYIAYDWYLYIVPLENRIDVHLAICFAQSQCEARQYEMARKHECANIFLGLFWITPAACTILFAHLNVVKWFRPSRAYIFFIFQASDNCECNKTTHIQKQNWIFFSTKKFLTQHFINAIVDQMIFVVWLFDKPHGFTVEHYLADCWLKIGLSLKLSEYINLK